VSYLSHVASLQGRHGSDVDEDGVIDDDGPTFEAEVQAAEADKQQSKETAAARGGKVQRLRNKGGALDMYSGRAGLAKNQGSVIMAFDHIDEHYLPGDRPLPRSYQLEQLVHSEGFMWLIMFLVLVNTCLMASDHAGQPDYWRDTLWWSNIVFVSIFGCELALKLYALGGRLFWRYRFNRYDALVVLVSAIEIAAEEGFGAQPMGLAVFRAVR
jgi:hypothetical protein